MRDKFYHIIFIAYSINLPAAYILKTYHSYLCRCQCLSMLYTCKGTMGFSIGIDKVRKGYVFVFSLYL